jgi:hypothetical protein
LTPDIDLTKLSSDEIRLIELYRAALAKKYAELTLTVHNGELASAALTEKFKF